MLKVYKYLRNNKWAIPHLFYSILFNLYYLPFSQARYLPIICGFTQFKRMKGTIILLAPECRFGMIELGKPMISICGGGKFVFQNYGKVIFEGSASIGKNSKLSISSKGIVVFGDKFCATDVFRLICYKHVTFENNVLIGYETIVMDTNQHKLQDCEGNMVGTTCEPIFVGESTWISSFCIILPGSYIPPRCVVATRSLVNKKFSKQFCLLAGSPAKQKIDNVWRNPFDDKIDY